MFLGWEDQPSAVDYSVAEYSVMNQQQSSQPIQISSGIKSHAILQGLQRNAKYMVHVAGFSANLMGPFSDPVHFIPSLNGE